MASVQAAVVAGLGVSIVPLSSVTPQMRILGRGYPDPGRLDIGVVRAAGTRKDIMDALQRVTSQTLGALLVTRAA
jgi:DNA-binding transcriptional LysR family regulator